MQRAALLDRLGLEPDATDAEVLVAAKALRAQARKRISSAATPEAARAEEAALAELDALLAAFGLAPAPQGGDAPTPVASPLSRTMLRDLPSAGAASDQPALAGLSQSMLGDLPGAAPLAGTSGMAAEAPGSQVPVQPGRVLAGRYELKRLLGAGGMGAVYAAHDRTRQEDVALKVILPALLRREDARTRFLQEAKVSTSLSHPGIVKCFDVGQDGELLFLTMELLSGQTLRQRIEAAKQSSQSVPLEEVVRVGKALCDSLGHAHTKTVHRDVKPENIFLCSDGRVLLMDFGIARLLNHSQFTRTGAAMGTAYYMAPEQLVSAGEADHRADQFSTCVVLYELLTGRLPAGAVAPVRRLRPDAPPKLADAVMRGLSGDAAGRHADMAALSKELDARMPAWRKPQVQRLAVALFAAAALIVGVVWREPAWNAYQESMRDPVAKQKAQDALELAREQLDQLQACSALGGDYAGSAQEAQLVAELQKAQSLHAARQDKEASSTLEEPSRQVGQWLTGKQGKLRDEKRRLRTDVEQVRADLDAALKHDPSLDFDRGSELDLRLAELDSSEAGIVTAIKAVRASRDTLQAADAWRKQVLAKLGDAREAARAELKAIEPRIEAVMLMGGDFPWDGASGVKPPKETLATDARGQQRSVVEVLTALRTLADARAAAEQWLAATGPAMEDKLRKQSRQLEILEGEVAAVCRAYPVAAAERARVTQASAESPLKDADASLTASRVTPDASATRLAELQRAIQRDMEFLDKYGDAAIQYQKRQITNAVEEFKKKRSASARSTEERKRELEDAQRKSPTDAAGSKRLALMQSELARLAQRDQELQELWTDGDENDLNDFNAIPIISLEGLNRPGKRCDDLQAKREHIHSLLVGKAGTIEMACVEELRTRREGEDAAAAALSAAQNAARVAIALMQTHGYGDNSIVADIDRKSDQIKLEFDAINQADSGLSSADAIKRLKEIEASAVGHLAMIKANPRLYALGLDYTWISGVEFDSEFNVPRRITHKQSGIEFQLVRKGTFTMGSPESEGLTSTSFVGSLEGLVWRLPDEKLHKRRIQLPYYLGVTEVSQSQWDSIMGQGSARDEIGKSAMTAASNARRTGGPVVDRPFIGPTLPMNYLSWNDAKNFCHKAGSGFRLPSEAEWEYACRAGTSSPFHWGGQPDVAKANFTIVRDWGDPDALGTTIAVKSLEPNAWGFYQMHGNVGELCEDYHGDYPMLGTEAPNTTPNAEGLRIVRGGSFACYAYGWGTRTGVFEESAVNSGCRSASRTRVDPQKKSRYSGIRVARSIPE